MFTFFWKSGWRSIHTKSIINTVRNVPKITVFAAILKLSCGCLYCLFLTTYIITKHVCIVIWAEPERLIYKVFCFLAATAHVSSFDFSGGIINHNHHKSAGMIPDISIWWSYILCFFSSYLLNSFIFI